VTVTKKMLYSPAPFLGLSALTSPPFEVEVLEVDFEMNTALVRHSTRGSFLSVLAGESGIGKTITRRVLRSELAHIAPTETGTTMAVFDHADMDELMHSITNAPYDRWACPCGCQAGFYYARDDRALWVSSQKAPLSHPKMRAIAIETRPELDKFLHHMDAAAKYPSLASALIAAFERTPHDPG
jgi:hypothetical protein